MKVVKFGGSSLANGIQIEKVLQIIKTDKQRRVVVVSAPGKRYSEDVKVTDLLISCGKKYLEFGGDQDGLELIVARYQDIVNELDLSEDIVDELKTGFLSALESDRSVPERYMDRVMASGEDQLAKVIAAYFTSQGVTAQYVSPKDAPIIVTNEPGNAQVMRETYEKLLNLREKDGVIVVPGFFGYSEEGYVVTFPRSGSDITGSVLARGLQASVYENFTDVDAVYSVNPNIVEKPREIRELTYGEMRELSYAGFTVFHDEALAPAFQAGVPVHIKNTNNPLAEGTLIVKERVHADGPVSGIASDKGFCSIFVSKYLMNREIGFGRRLLGILEQYGISYEHTPSGIDDISVVLRQDQMPAELEGEIIERIYQELCADRVYVQRDLALIMIVGVGMRHNVGTTAKASTALANAEINIEMLNQGSSEVSIMFGIKATDERKAVQALYKEFFNS